jgi:hypothetical protein
MVVYHLRFTNYDVQQFEVPKNIHESFLPLSSTGREIKGEGWEIYLPVLFIPLITNHGEARK